MGELSQYVYWTRLLSFKTIQSKVLTGLLIVRNTLRWHLYITGLMASPSCRRCVAVEETLTHILCVWSLGDTQTYLFGFLFLDREGVRSLSPGEIWNFIIGKGSHDLDISLRGTNSLSKRPMCIRIECLNPVTILFYSILFPSIPPTCGKSLKLIHIKLI